MATYSSIVDQVLRKSERTEGQLWVGICGAPGSGKSTLSEHLLKALPSAVVVPMDGFHYYRSELDAFDDPLEAHRRRGAHFTFNAHKFVLSVSNAKERGSGTFPSFDHSIGDPVEDDIVVTTEHKIVIVEGLYLLLNIPPWSLIRDLLDLVFFVDCPEDELFKRLVARHIATLGLSEAKASDRATNNDLLNAKIIALSKEYADIIVNN